jgi:membrane protease YdiL (CAAX protease family)
METIQLIFLYSVCYGVFLVLACFAKANSGFRLIREDGTEMNGEVLLGLQFSGILWLGIIPLISLQQSTAAIIFGNEPLSFRLFFQIALLIAAAAYLSFIQAEKTYGKLVACKIPAPQFSPAFQWQYFTLRAVYLISYEIFFRGFLLADSIQHFGMVWAITINTVLYSLAHLPGGRKEMLACIPIGLALCGVVIMCQAVWPAIILHLVMALVYEIRLVNNISKTLKPVI